MNRYLKTRKVSRYERKPLSEGLQVHDIVYKPVMTARDREVLLSIYNHRCLTTEQIAEMHFKYDSKGKVNSQASVIARRRLRKLFDLSLIDRFFIDVADGQGSSQAHVILDRLGARVVAGLLDTDLNELNWRYEMNEARLPYLGHMVSINDFYLSLLRSARELKHECIGYRVETHVRHEFPYWGQKIIFNPDAYGQYWNGEEGFHFFLELDNGTMTPSTFQKKHQRYTAFYDSDEYIKFYETFPMILTVTTSYERAQALARVIGEVDNTDKIWLFASEEDVKKNGIGTVWLDKHRKPTTLLE